MTLSEPSQAPEAVWLEFCEVSRSVLILVQRNWTLREVN